MVTKAKHLAVWWHCDSSLIGHHIVSGSCAPKTNRYRNCACERGQQVSNLGKCLLCVIEPIEKNSNKLLFICFCRAVSSIYSTVFFPIFPWIFQIMVCAFALVIGLYLASVGVPVNQVIRMSNDSSCLCTGPASNYRVSYILLLLIMAEL